MNKKPPAADPLDLAMRARDVGIRESFCIEDGYDEERASVKFEVRERGYSASATNPDRLRGQTFLRRRSRLTLGAALQALRLDESYSPGLQGDMGVTCTVHAKGMDAWIKELLSVGYVAHGAAAAMADRSVEELLRVRERFSEGLEAESCVRAFGELRSVTEGTRFEALSLEQMAKVSACPDPFDIERLVACLDESDDSLVPNTWLPKPRRRSPHEKTRPPGVSASALAACVDEVDLKALLDGPLPSDPAAMAEALRLWVRLPDAEMTVQSPWGFRFRSRSMLVRWAGGAGAVRALRDADPQAAAAFLVRFSATVNAEVSAKRRSGGAPPAPAMAAGAANLVEEFATELFRDLQHDPNGQPLQPERSTS